MQGVIVIAEKLEGSIFIEAVEFPDRSRRTTHFAEHHGRQRVQGRMVDSYTVYFDDDSNTPVKLYKTQHGTWFLDD